MRIDTFCRLQSVRSRPASESTRPATCSPPTTTTIECSNFPRRSAHTATRRAQCWARSSSTPGFTTSSTAGVSAFRWPWRSIRIRRRITFTSPITRWRRAIRQNRVLAWYDAQSFRQRTRPPTLVFGQPDFYHTAANTDVRGAEWLRVPTLSTYPPGMTVDNSSNLYIVDNGNNRVLEYNNPFSGIQPGNGPVLTPPGTPSGSAGRHSRRQSIRYLRELYRKCLQPVTSGLRQHYGRSAGCGIRSAERGALRLGVNTRQAVIEYDNPQNSNATTANTANLGIRHLRRRLRILTIASGTSDCRALILQPASPWTRRAICTWLTPAPSAAPDVPRPARLRGRMHDQRRRLRMRGRHHRGQGLRHLRRGADGTGDFTANDCGGNITSAQSLDCGTRRIQVAWRSTPTKISTRMDPGQQPRPRVPQRRIALGKSHCDRGVRTGRQVSCRATLQTTTASRPTAWARR